MLFFPRELCVFSSDRPYMIIDDYDAATAAECAINDFIPFVAESTGLSERGLYQLIKTLARDIVASVTVVIAGKTYTLPGAAELPPVSRVIKMTPPAELKRREHKARIEADPSLAELARRIAEAYNAFNSLPEDVDDATYGEDFDDLTELCYNLELSLGITQREINATGLSGPFFILDLLDYERANPEVPRE